MCTRVYLHNENLPDNAYLTGRNMDWAKWFNTNLWAFPSGVERISASQDQQNRFTWKSKYKSLFAGMTAFEDVEGCQIAVSNDGVNEKGLVANGLWLSESEYNQPKENEKALSISLWVQYMLDNYFSVKEAVEDWVHNRYCIIAEEIPSEFSDKYKMATLHLSLSDAYGNSAIFEYYRDSPDEVTKLHITTNIKGIEGNRHVSVIHEQDCAVMTNSPVYEKQVKLNYYWTWLWEKEEDDVELDANRTAKLPSLPGTNRPPDRYARVSHYERNLKRADNYNEWVGQMLSLIRTASVPLGYRKNELPNNSNTIWSAVSDHKQKRFYFQSSKSPSLVWIDLDKLDLNNSETILYLPIDKEDNIQDIYSGNVSDKMQTKEISKFLSLVDFKSKETTKIVNDEPSAKAVFNSN